jgi:hypothetical protein
MRMSSIEPRSGSIHLWTSFSICAFTALLRIASICRAKCGLDKLQPVIDAASSAADPDERRARGPHSLAAVSRSCRLELIRHAPRRSNLCSSTLVHHAVEEKSLDLVPSVNGVGAAAYAGILKASPRASIAQAMRAFFAAMATTAFQ